jgi:hypothetical protein
MPLASLPLKKGGIRMKLSSAIRRRVKFPGRFSDLALLSAG